MVRVEYSLLSNPLKVMTVKTRALAWHLIALVALFASLLFGEKIPKNFEFESAHLLILLIFTGPFIFYILAAAIFGNRKFFENARFILYGIPFGHAFMWTLFRVFWKDAGAEGAVALIFTWAAIAGAYGLSCLGSLACGYVTSTGQK